MRHVAIVFLFFCALSQESLALVTERHTTQTYEVVIAPRTSLLRAINNSSPIRQDGQIYHGYTAWDIRWNFRWNTLANGSCAITSVSTILTTNITLPKLQKKPGVDSKEFDTYLSALTHHEEGHKQLSRNAAHEIDHEISRLPPRSNCKSIEADANRTGMAILDRARAADIEYDVATKHGCTQRACLNR